MVKLSRFTKLFLVVLMILSLTNSALATCYIEEVLQPQENENVRGIKTIVWDSYETPSGNTCDAQFVSRIEYYNSGSWYDMGYSGSTLVSDGSWDWDSSSIPDIDNDGVRVRVETVDGYAGSFAESHEFNVDNTAPTGGVITNPTNGDAFSSTVNIQWSAVVDAHYSHTIIEYSTNGVDWTYLTRVDDADPSDGGSYSWDISGQTPGSTYQVRLTHYDLAGNSNEENMGSDVFTIDHSNPTLTVTLTPGEFRDTQTLTIDYTVSGNDANPVSFGWTIDDAATPVNPIPCTGDCTVDGSFTWVVSTSDTSSTEFKVQASTIDDAGNPGAILSDRVTVDNADPVAGSNAPADGATVNTNLRPPVSLLLSDVHSGIDESTIDFTLENLDTALMIESGISTSDSRLTYTAGTLIYQPDSGDSDYGTDGDQIRVTVYVEDEVGNSHTEIWTFTIDTTTPVVTLVSPADETWFTTTGITHTFNVQSTSGSTHTCQLFVDDFVTPVATESGVTHDVDTSFSAVTVSEGSHRWQVTCTRDENALSDTSSRWDFHVDSQDPTITLIDIQPNDPTNNQRPEVTFEVDDATSGIIDTNITIGDGTTTFNIASSQLVCSTDGEGGYDCILTYDYDLSDSSYIFDMYAEDAQGHSASLSSNPYIIDSTIPVCSDDADETIWHTSPAVVTVTWDSSDTLGGLVYTINGGGTQSQTVAPFIGITIGSDGPNVLAWACYDHAGNQQDVTRNIFVDTTAPVIDNFAYSPTGVSFDLTDTTSGVNLTSLDIVLDTIPYDSSDVSCTLVSQTYSCTLTTPISDGSHDITIDVDDVATNPATTFSSTFGVDTTAPTCTDNVPSGWQTSVPTVTVTWSDNIDSVGDIEGCYDGASCESNVDVSTADFNSFSEGTTSFSYSCTDSNDNTQSPVAQNVQVDTQAPVIDNVVFDPVDPSNDNQPTLTFTVDDTTSGVDINSIEVDDGINVPAFFDGDGDMSCTPTATGYACELNYDSDVELPEGTTSFTITADDVAGNSATNTDGSYEVDTIIPVCTDDAVESTWLNSVPTVTVTWDDGAVSSGFDNFFFSVSGEVAGGGAGTSVLPIAPITGFFEGINGLTYNCVDNAGNTQTESRIIWIDVTSPVIDNVVFDPVDPSNDNEPSVEFTVADESATITTSGVVESSITYSDGTNTFTVANDQMSCTLGGSTYTCNIEYDSAVTLNEGDYNIEIDANDDAGNAANTYTFNAYTIDTVIPECYDDYVSSPTWQTTVPTIHATWVDDTPSSGMAWMRYCLGVSCDPEAGTDFTEFTFPQGSTRLYWTCHDAAGNRQDQFERVVMVDSGVPTIGNVNIDPADPSNSGRPSINFTVEDAVSGIDLYEVELDDGYNSPFNAGDGDISCSSTATGYLCQLYYGVSNNLPDDDYNITITAQDNAGNEAEAHTTSDYTVDTVPPYVTVSHNPVDGGYTDDEYQPITIELTDDLSGVDPSTLTFSVAGTIYRNGVDSEVSWDGVSLLTFTPSVPFTDAQVVPVFINAIDRAGNAMSQIYFEFTVDLEAPISSNAATDVPGVTQGNPITFTGQIDDTVRVMDARVTLDGTIVDLDETNTGDGVFGDMQELITQVVDTSVLSVGNHEIILYGYDGFRWEAVGVCLDSDSSDNPIPESTPACIGDEENGYECDPVYYTSTSDCIEKTNSITFTVTAPDNGQGNGGGSSGGGGSGYRRPFVPEEPKEEDEQPVNPALAFVRPPQQGGSLEGNADEGNEQGNGRQLIEDSAQSEEPEPESSSMASITGGAVTEGDGDGKFPWWLLLLLLALLAVGGYYTYRSKYQNKGLKLKK